MTALEQMARRIYEQHRRAKIRSRRRDRGPVPRWDEIADAERERRLETALQLVGEYAAARSHATESAINA